MQQATAFLSIDLAQELCFLYTCMVKHGTRLVSVEVWFWQRKLLATQPAFINQTHFNLLLGEFTMVSLQIWLILVDWLRPSSIFVWGHLPFYLFLRSSSIFFWGRLSFFWGCHSSFKKTKNIVFHLFCFF